MSRSRKQHPDPAWKKDERKIARSFHLDRNPHSGNRRSTGRRIDWAAMGDSRKLTPEECAEIGIKESPHLVIEVKRKEGKKRHTACRLLDDIREIGKHQDNIGFVALKEKDRHGFAVVVHSKDLKRFAMEVIEHYATHDDS